jgi:CubicO group peptidase (beta-lactamase class C family)
MERASVSGFVAFVLGLGLTQAMAGTAGEPQQQGHGTLALPATTACLENALTNGQATGRFSGLSAAVVLDGRLVYRRGFGTVSPTSTQPITPSTRFRIGSITKSMTATALLSLAEERRIHLHAPASALLPGLALQGEPGWSERLTAHRLLSHQGGIEDSGGEDGPHDDGALAAAFYDPAFLDTARLMVSPGSFYNYSNRNFMLAGLLAETAAGHAYRDVMRKRVFKPLGMTRAAFLTSEVTADTDAASGIVDGGPVIVAPGAYDNAISRPAGFAWTSVEDLARYSKFLLEGNTDVLSRRNWRAMQTRQVNTLQQLDLQGYGYGLAVEDAVVLPDGQNQPRFYNGVKAVWHDGDIAGYTSLMSTLPQQRFAYVALVNGNDVNLGACYRTAAVETIGNRLPAPSPFPDPDIQRDRFADYVGNYADRIGLAGRAVVSLTPAGELNIRFPDLDEQQVEYDPRLYPTSRNNFVLNIIGTSLRVTGIREQGSDIAHLRLRLTVLSRSADTQATQRSVPSLVPSIDVRALERAVREASRERVTLLED